jgi:hypothetical protein
MQARDLARLNGQLAIALKARRTDGATGSDEELTNTLLAEHGADVIDLWPLISRLRRSAARRASRQAKLSGCST